jgi:putative FmdB family regulatory protein
VPLYEYHYPKCRSTFERLRPMSESSQRVACPNGHAGASRVVSLIARVRAGDGAETLLTGGGCGCGGNCSCGGH